MPIAWARIASLLEPLYPASKAEPAWPPLAIFKALPLTAWYDLSDVKLAEALEDRPSFRRFCGFSISEATPARTEFMRFQARPPRADLTSIDAPGIRTMVTIDSDFQPLHT